ncbi:hypothetical protein AURDEDRAFT_187188 [Auricularia subglabra TFB-10046 SS5]|nr:hypothetical protein AURDEDRAFT_187188 [Auricularia subglabra TFB-10046 SS5]
MLYPHQLPDLSLPAMQQPMHDFSLMGLPAPRRQNVACDPCRNRKVKCMQIPGQDKCQHCIQKNIACTHKMQEITTARKRSAAQQRRRGLSGSDSQAPNVDAPLTPSLPANRGGNGQPQQQQQQRPQTPASPILQLIQYLLSPEHSHPVPDFVGGPSSAQYRSYTRAASYGPLEDWGDYGQRLIEDEAYRIEFTWDLVEAFFQASYCPFICHARLPFLHPDDFRSSLRAALPGYNGSPFMPASAAFSHPSFPPGQISRSKTLHPALLATVLAWGAKFAEHQILNLDRQANGGRSRIARTLVHKAREVAEGEKIHRLATADNIIIALLLEPLQSQNTNDIDGFRGYWLNCAVRHLIELRINNRQTLLSLSDPDLQGTMTFAWWMAVFADAYSAVYFRRKPLIEDHDTNVDFWHYDIPRSQSPHQKTPSPSPEQQGYVHWYPAADHMTKCARQMCRVLWVPQTEAEGVPYDQLCAIVSALDDWRVKHLEKVGMPNFTNFAARSEWGFLEAVSMCASDATYHTMWIILFNAIEEYGIRELREAGILVSMASDAPITCPENAPLDPSLLSRFEETRTKLHNEAGLGALRIAELMNVLAQQNYLRLDPNVMHFSAYAAGLHLARLGRPETITCINGLRQYGIAYEDALDQADELEHIFRSISADPSPQHTPQQPASAMPMQAFDLMPLAPHDALHFQQNGFAPHQGADGSVLAGAEALMGLGEHVQADPYPLYQSPMLGNQHTPPPGAAQSYPIIFSPQQ